MISGAGADAGSGGIAVGANQLVLNDGATVASAITLGSGAVSNSSGTGTITSAGSLQLGANGTLASSGTGLVVNGVISETGGARTLTTSGLVTLGNDNTYTGGTTVNSGTLTISGAGADAGSGGIVVGGNRLVVNSGAMPANAVSLGGGTIGNTAGAGTLNGVVTLTAGSFFESSGTGLTLAGGIGGTGGITAQGGTVNAVRDRHVLGHHQHHRRTLQAQSGSAIPDGSASR